MSCTLCDLFSKTQLVALMTADGVLIGRGKRPRFMHHANMLVSIADRSHPLNVMHWQQAIFNKAVKTFAHFN